MGAVLVIFLLVLLVWPSTMVAIGATRDRRSPLAKRLTPEQCALLGVKTRRRR